MDWVGWIALFIAIFALIVIIVVVYIFERDNGLIRTFTDRFAITTGTAASPDSFVASPASIYIVNSGARGAFVLNITAYPNIDIGLAQGFGTQFQVDNTTSPATVTVVAPGGAATSVTGAKPGGVASPAVVAPGTTGTFLWLTASTIKRLS
jgi:hypothetical protein